MEIHIHGGDRYGRQAMLDFSENVNPLGLPDSVRDALIQSISYWNWYPDSLCRDLRSALAHTLCVPGDWLIFGSGAVDLIYHTVQALHPKQALLLAPTFSEYAYALASVGCEVSRHFLLEADGFALTDRMLEQINPSLDMVILCNPNNPTGHTAGRELLCQVAQKCAQWDITLLIDECFLPFLDSPQEETMLGCLPTFPNVLILGAFTKFYALAGLRLGFLVCAGANRRESVTGHMPPWNISVPAQVAGVAALKDSDYGDRTRPLIASERTRMARELGSMGVRIYGSQANYLFFQWKGYTDLDMFLEQEGMLIRSCKDYTGLDSRFYRVGIKTRQMNTSLLDAMGRYEHRKEGCHG